MGFLSYIVPSLQAGVLTGGAAAGAGALLSDKESAADKLKTSLATGAGAAAGLMLPQASGEVVRDLMTRKANSLANRLYDRENLKWEELYKALGKDKTKYSGPAAKSEAFSAGIHFLPENAFEKARTASSRMKALRKANTILHKLEDKSGKIGAALGVVSLAAAPLGGYLGYKYMED